MKERKVYISTYLISEPRKMEAADCQTIHRININYSSKDKRGGWYRQVSAMDGFHGRLNKRFSKYWYTAKRYHMKPQVKYMRADHMTIESLKMFCNTVNSSPTSRRTRDYIPTIKWVSWGSIWDFFDHIGYDHKNISVKELDKFVILRYD